MKLLKIKMNAIGAAETLKNVTVRFADPFNYPMISRQHCMTLNTIREETDYTKTKVSSFVTPRRVSNNLSTLDIPGKTILITA